MKRPILMTALWLGVIMLMPIPIETAYAAKVKIGLIDIQKIMRESKAAKNARDVFLKDRESKRALFREKQEKAQILQEELKKSGRDMSVSDRKQKADKLEREIKELRRLKSDLEEELKKKEEGLTRKLLKEVREVVQKFLKKEKYTVILEKKAVAASDDAIDITEQIIKLYDSQKK